MADKKKEMNKSLGGQVGPSGNLGQSLAQGSESPKKSEKALKERSDKFQKLGDELQSKQEDEKSEQTHKTKSSKKSKS